MKVNMKDTNYYKSGRHGANGRKNCLKNSEKIHKCQFCKKLFSKSNLSKHERSCIINPKNVIYCNECDIKLSNKKRFCNRSCAAKFNNRKRTVESRQKQTKTIVNSFKSGKIKPLCGKNKLPKFYKVKFSICKICNKCYYTRGWSSTRVTCGIQSCITSASFANRTYHNGKQKSEMFFNPYENKEILLESTWEVRVARLLCDMGINWIRPKPIQWYDGKKDRLYYPDFYLVDFDVYLDPKNPYCMELDKQKIQEISNKVSLIVGDIDLIIDFIKNL